MVEGEKRPGWRIAVGNLVHKLAWAINGDLIALKSLMGKEGVIRRGGQVMARGKIVDYGGTQIIYDQETRLLTFLNEIAGDKIVEVQSPK